jgi:hypothetical protein
MRASWAGSAAVVVLGASLFTGAAAQNIILDAPGFTGKPTARLPDVKPAPLAWPRLDPGAALCRTEFDLDRLAARRRGEPDGPADCRIVTVPTAVTITQRRSGGRTEVRLTDSPDVGGWTDVWLPDKAPASAGVRPAMTR